MGLLNEIVQEAAGQFRAGFDLRCGCTLPDDIDLVAALRAVQPAHSNKVTTTLGVPWQHRGTIERRLNELRRQGRVRRHRGKEWVVA